MQPYPSVRRYLFLVAFACLSLCLPDLPAAEATAIVRLVPLPDRVRIEIDGELFTEYIFGGNIPKPYLYPINAADGTRLSREHPMVDTPEDERDHPHHRSLWFGHGEVNGQNFWGESDGAGRIVHESLVEMKSGPVGLLRSRNRWESKDGVVVCADETTVRVQAVPCGRLLDYEITLRAPISAPVTFGDTKEGTMAMRLSPWMAMRHRLLGNPVTGPGHAINSVGDRDAATWGKRAAWADYFAPRDDKVHGVAIFDHPQNPRHPTWWMLRDYGLFAANPFGRHDFENLKDQPKIGEFVLPPGGSVTFRYRFLVHEGDTTTAGVAERYSEYAKR